MHRVAAIALPSFSESLVLMLVHSLWQAALISCLVWIAFRLLPARKAEIRYGVATTGLLLVVLSAFATWSVLRLDPNVTDSNEYDVKQLDRSIADATPSTSRPMGVSGSLPSHEPNFTNSSSTSVSRSLFDRRVIAAWLSVVWMCVATILLARGLFGVATVRSWATTRITGDSNELAPLHTIVREFCQLLKLRQKVRLMVSDRISIPAVIGVIWPTILIPAAMLSGVSVEQWRVVIAHELAHVKRWDVLVEIGQMVVESLMFFNPSVWWLSRQMRIEREARCDALAAAVCGQPLTVARTLLDVAATSLSIRSTQNLEHTLGNALAFAEPSSPGELTDRVQRLIEPDRWRGPRISWFGVILLFFLLIAICTGLKLSTDVVIQAAARLMTPKERIDTLVKFEAEQNGNFVPPDEDQSDSKPVDFSSRSLDQPHQLGEKIPVEIVVRTDDGSPVEPDSKLQYISQSGHGTTQGPFTTLQNPVPEVRMTMQFFPCRLRIVAIQAGRVAAISPLTMLVRGEPTKTIEVVLAKGFNREVVVQDIQQHGIPNVQLRINLQVTMTNSSGSSTSTISQNEFDGDADGRVQLLSVGQCEYDIEIQAPGFQGRRITHEFTSDAVVGSEDKPLVITLNPAHPTKLRVVDARTNQLVPRVRFRLITQRRGNNGFQNQFNRKQDSPNRWLDHAVSDENGLAVFDHLEDGVNYTFVPLADGYGMTNVSLKAGDPERTIKMLPPLIVTGRVTGEISRLPTNQVNGKMGHTITYSRMTGDQSNVCLVDLDDDGRFSIDEIAYGEKLHFSLPDEDRAVELNESVNDLKFHIQPGKDIDLPTRSVIIRLTGTDLGADARGSLVVNSRHPSIDLGKNRGQFLPVRANEVRFEAPIGGRISFAGNELVGYLIQDQNEIEITAGTGPQVITAPVTPMGGIEVSVKRHDGTPARSAIIHILAKQLPTEEKDTLRIKSPTTSASSTALCTIPLGGRYRIFAREETESSNAWAISDEIPIDQTNPFAKVSITLGASRDVKIKVLDPQGKAVEGQPVRLHFSIKLKRSDKQYSEQSVNLSAITSQDGFALFRGVSVDHSISPFELTCQAIVEPSSQNKLSGITQELNLRKPLEVRLKKGVSADGILINARNGKPIPNASLRIMPNDFASAGYKSFLSTTTDDEGHFHFEGLEPIRYHGHVDNAALKGAVFEPGAQGGYRIFYPNGSANTASLELDGGSDKPAHWEVVPYPDKTDHSEN